MRTFLFGSISVMAGVSLLVAPVFVFAQTVSSNSSVTVTATVPAGTASGTTSGTSGTTGTTGTSGTTTTGGTTGGSGSGGTSGGSSSGGGSGFTSPTSVTFSGRAYPLSTVILLEDGQQALQTIAGPDAQFNFTVGNLDPGTFTFSILAEDSSGRRSTLFTIPIVITNGVSSTVSGIFLAPTIDIDKTTVARGDNLAIFGQTVPNSQVTIAVHSANPIFEQTQADNNGVYLYNFDTTPLAYGQHDTQSKSALTASNQVSAYGTTLAFTVGTESTPVTSACPLLRGDFNGDCRVNLVDFSILAYWYHRPNFPPALDLNGDGKIDLADFSILAYYWTG